MSDCAALRDDLAAYALGALDEREAGAIEDHLGGCERCRDAAALARAGGRPAAGLGRAAHAAAGAAREPDGDRARRGRSGRRRRAEA